MKCKNCSDMNCPYRTTDAEKECEYSHVLGHEPLTFEQMKELQKTQLQHDWDALRNQAAIAAMQGLINNTDLLKEIAKKVDDSKMVRYNVALNAIEYADALIEQLKKR